LTSNDYKSYAAVFKALGDETRLKIFNMLSEGEMCACRLLDDFAISQSTLSYHMKIMCDCGLVNGRRDGIWMRYTVNAETLANLQEFFNRIEPGSAVIDTNCCDWNR